MRLGHLGPCHRRCSKYDEKYLKNLKFMTKTYEKILSIYRLFLSRITHQIVECFAANLATTLREG